ncbi:MAG: 16S rRNA (guanine(527)-N(7))-methyltransferase RsmG [Alloprevotella sp.]
MTTDTTVQLVYDHFKDLSERQREQFAALDALYHDWNAKINVISRKDIDNLYPHHVLHSLGIAKVIRFRPGTEVLDLGTGGGFPGIPLAIMFPESRFTLMDSIGKKVKVAEAVAEAIGLENVTAVHRNVIEEKGKYDFVVSRAVADMAELVRLVKKNIRRDSHNALPNGIICLKGGDLHHELKPFKRVSEQWELSTYFDDEFFKTKKVAFVAM